jgi:hypothetical protein
MTIAEIVAALPRGLHDALLETISIDWPSAILRLTVRVKVTERQDLDRRAEIEVTGLVWCALDPPDIDAARRSEPLPGGGLLIDAGEGAANDDAKRRLLEIPDGTFLHWLFVRDWNRFIHICGRWAAFRWLEPQPVRARVRDATTRSGAAEAQKGDPLQDIVGQDLSAVTFVRDYIQLQFDGPLMNVMTPLSVVSAALNSRSGDENFRNVLCDQISKLVVSVRADEGDALTITFSDASSIAISLKREDYVGLEAVVVYGRDSRLAVL